MIAQKIDLSFLNYITDDQFRDSLVADYREMRLALDQKCWKSAQVMAGSMIEAILIDYILAKNTDSTKVEGILKMDLGKAIDHCKAAKVLTDKTAGLCIVIKDSRNLIHPGRIIRLEQSVTEDDANVAATLIKMVAEDISKKQQESYGYTAKQIINKIQTDPDAFPGVMKSLLSNLQEREKRALLLDLLPQENSKLRRAQQRFELWDEQYFTLATQIVCVKQCFAELAEHVSVDLKRELVRKYIEILHTAPGLERREYEEAFFSAALLSNSTVEQHDIILDHYFSVVSGGATEEFIENVYDISDWIPDDDKADRWLNKLYVAYFAQHSMSEARFKLWFRRTVTTLKETVYKRFRKIAEQEHARHMILDDQCGAIEKASEILEIERFPF